MAATKQTHEEQHAIERDLRRIVYQDKEMHDRHRIPAVLYHYTTASGVLGILESGRLHMTPDNTASDPLELLYGNYLLRSQLRHTGLADVNIGDINPFEGGMKSQTFYGVYMTSFCAQDDTPHHWQNFGDRGRGFSIGIQFPDRTEGWTIRDDGPTHLRLRPIVYKLEQQQSLLQRLLVAAEGYDASKRNSPGQRALRQVLGEVLPSFKHVSFETEDEWRLFIPRVSAIVPSYAGVRARGSVIEAYLEARGPGGQLPLDSVRAGPRVDLDGRAAVEAFAASKKYQNLQVFGSEYGPGGVFGPDI